MLDKKKQKALLVVSVAGLILIAVVIATGYLAVLTFPLLIALICIIVGMIFKWVIEWLIKNIHRFKVKEKAEVVKKKLKIDEGIGLVKDSINTLRNKGDDVSKNEDMGAKDSKIS